MLVKVLTGLTYKSHCFTYPIRCFQRQLEKSGIRVRLCYRPSARLYDADVVCITGEAFVRSRLGGIRHSKRDFIEQARDRNRTLVWFDTSDSTGTTSFEVLPFVDLYAKNQVLRNVRRYAEPVYGNRIYAEFYRHRFGIEERAGINQRSAASERELWKIGVSWNLGLGDFTSFRAWPRRARALLGLSGYRVSDPSPEQDRTLDVSFRGSTTYAARSVSFHRQETERRIGEIRDLNRYAVSDTGTVGFSAYRDELRRTRLAVSPFGLGEVCFRDFECFLSGAALFKPRMEHLLTWPNYYEPEVTYEPYAWDFSDFTDRLTELLGDEDRRLRIAKKGRERFVESRSELGGVEFADHFAGLMNAAISNGASHLG